MLLLLFFFCPVGSGPAESAFGTGPSLVPLQFELVLWRGEGVGVES